MLLFEQVDRILKRVGHVFEALLGLWRVYKYIKILGARILKKPRQ